jgi:UDP-N-acetyl-D-glucosamine dehydrogenase
MSHGQTLEQRIKDKSAVVGVIGLGYVGLPLAKAFFDAGLPVIGFDIDPTKIRDLDAGHNYLVHLGADFCKQMAKGAKGNGSAERPRFFATIDFSKLGECDAIIICVPTPLGKHLDPDLSYVVNTTEQIAKTLRPGQLIVLESTSYPRTTRDDMLPVLEKTGFKCGVEAGYYLAFSPEREDPGRKDHNTQTIPKLVGGIDKVSGKLAADLYRLAIKTVVEVSSAEVAEAAKILENTFRAVNIAMVNELKMLYDAMGIDVWEVIEAASTKPFGFMPFFPGPGLGGHCIPIDPFYLTWKAREYHKPTRFIELAGQINQSMPDYVVDRVAHALNERGKSVRGARALILGLAYKADIDDVRESPSFELIEKLDERGAHVDYSDPHVPKTKRMRRYDLHMSSVALDPQTLAGYDVVIVSTAHSAFDWELIAKHSRLVVDTRNALKRIKDRANIMRA